MINISSKEIIEKYEMSSHPEGGYFLETYRSSGNIEKESLPQNISGGKRSYSTGILFLLPQGTKSNFHRIKSDEMWHFYLGGAMTVVEIHDDGSKKETVLGQNILAGEKLQYVVPANCWFASFPNKESEYSFVGCTVSPGFDFADFELAKKQELGNLFPEHLDIIKKLT